jgi:hypothetical protein
MKKFTATIAVIAVSSMALPGCTSLFGKRMMTKAEAPMSRQAATYSTDLGRQHLDASRYGLAIETFQIALVTGEPAAPAFNGLGVAFARLGRYDLAERYFQRAAMIDPANQRYQQNLARLTASPTFAMRREGDMVASVVRDVATADAIKATAQVVSAAEAPGTMQRLGKGQVFIRSSVPQTAPQRSVRVAVGPSFRPLVRQELPPIAGEVPMDEVKSAPSKSKMIEFQPLLRQELPPIKQ